MFQQFTKLRVLSLARNRGCCFAVAVPQTRFGIRVEQQLKRLCFHSSERAIVKNTVAGLNRAKLAKLTSGQGGTPHRINRERCRLSSAPCIACTLKRLQDVRPNEQREAVQMATLLRDVGRGAFVHAFRAQRCVRFAFEQQLDAVRVVPHGSEHQATFLAMRELVDICAVVEQKRRDVNAAAAVVTSVVKRCPPQAFKNQRATRE